MNACRLLFLVTGLLLLFGCSKDDSSTQNITSVRLTSSVTPAQPRPGESFVFKIDLDYEKDLFQKGLEVPQIGSKIEGLSVIQDRLTEPSEVGTRIYVSREYELRAEVASAYILPEVEVKLDNGTSARAGKIYLEISTDAAGLGFEDIADIDPLVEQKFERNYSGYWILLGISSLILLSVLLYRRAIRDELLEIPVEPWEWVESEMQRVEIQNLLQTEQFREFYDAWSLICRGYLNRRFGIQAEESTLEELLPLLHDITLSDDLLADLKQLFQEADLARFADIYRGKSRLQKALDMLSMLVEQTTVKETEEDQFEDYVEGDESA